MMRLAALAFYPLKSGAGIEVEQAPLVATGLLHDRRFMLVDANGDFVTLRASPRLVTVTAAIGADAVRFSAAGRPPLEVALAQEAAQDEDPIDAQIWGEYVSARAVSPAANAWFTAFLGRPVRLVRFDAPTRRQVDPRYAAPGDSVHFADGFPLLVLGTASLDALSQRVGHPVAMQRFRGNLVVKTQEPFVEDRWRRIRVGEIEIDIVKPCARCVGVNVDPSTGLARKQTLAELARFRTHEQKVLFGQNAIHRGVGTLHVGDPVEVIRMES